VKRPGVLLAVASLAIVAALAGAGAARAADECNGLLVCLPAAGPWVVVPPGSPGRVEYLLACPRRGYIVAGTDVRISDRQLDVGIRGETGAPVGPGTTTRESVVFGGLFAGGARPVAFKPFVGCVPTSGGGARSQTARTSSHEGLKPTRPVDRLARTWALSVGTRRIEARCPGSARLVAASHAVGFRVVPPPSEAALRAVTTKVTPAPNGIAVTVTVRGPAGGAKPELQLLALCTRTSP